MGGNPTGGANPLQTRNGHGNADAEGNRTFPSYVYGELVSQYLSNFPTEYLPTATNAITYFPFGDTTKPARRRRASRCPYLFGYKGKAGTEPKDGVTRQWIQKATPTARTPSTCRTGTSPTRSRTGSTSRSRRPSLRGRRSTPR